MLQTRPQNHVQSFSTLQIELLEMIYIVRTTHLQRKMFANKKKATTTLRRPCWRNKEGEDCIGGNVKNVSENVGGPGSPGPVATVKQHEVS